MDYLFGQMKPGSGSGVAKITSGSKKHKISEGSWIVKAKEKGTVVKESIVFKMFVFEDEQEDLAKKYAASLYDSQLPDSSASSEQSELAKKVEESSSVVNLSVKSLQKIADEWRELSCAPVSESEAASTDDDMNSLPSPSKPPPPERSYAGMSVKGKGAGRVDPGERGLGPDAGGVRVHGQRRRSLRLLLGARPRRL